MADGWNPLLEDDPEVQMVFGIFRIPEGDSHTFHAEIDETALLLLNGKGDLTLDDETISFQRSSLIEENPLSVHTCRDTAVTVDAETECEFAVVRTANPEAFPNKIHYPADVAIDHRGKGILDNACYRIVRMIFDRTNSPEQVRLVLGEVVNFPGRWSSYPPHHHPQPELYYYRFNPDWGYGHGELGEDVYKLRHHDLLRITGERDHVQTVAPGFHMYYLWTVRHLPGDPYTGWEYTAPFDTLLA